ncbi:MAG: phosphate ABC transporter permease subunit PstC [Ilumatobacteraceae bacterium]
MDHAVVSLKPSGAARRRMQVERVIRGALGLASGVTVLASVLIVIALVRPALDFFADVPVGEFLGGVDWKPLFSPAEFGVWSIVVGSLWVALIAMVVSIPLGLGAAFYLSEYASHRVRRIVKPVLEVLAGIPTVVFGFFALNFVNPNIVAKLWPVGDVGTYSILAAGIVTGIMILPTVASLSEDAMVSVPNALREGAYALGSNRRQVSTGVVFPAALSGIVAAIVLGASRAIGETTIAVLAAGSKAQLTANPGEEGQTMAGFIGFAGIGDQPTGSTGYKAIFAVGTLLFIFTFLLNMLSIRIVRRFREVYE